MLQHLPVPRHSGLLTDTQASHTTPLASWERGWPQSNLCRNVTQGGSQKVQAQEQAGSGSHSTGCPLRRHHPPPHRGQCLCSGLCIGTLTLLRWLCSLIPRLPPGRREPCPLPGRPQFLHYAKKLCKHLHLNQQDTRTKTSHPRARGSWGPPFLRISQ